MSERRYEYEYGEDRETLIFWIENGEVMFSDQTEIDGSDLIAEDVFGVGLPNYAFWLASELAQRDAEGAEYRKKIRELEDDIETLVAHIHQWL